MPKKYEPRVLPTIEEWVEAPIETDRPSAWEPLVEKIRADPTGQWAKMERPDPWNSSFPTWFRNKYKDIELSVPTVYGRTPKPHYMYMRVKPELRGGGGVPIDPEVASAAVDAAINTDPCGEPTSTD